MLTTYAQTMIAPDRRSALRAEADRARAVRAWRLQCQRTAAGTLGEPPLVPRWCQPVSVTR